MSAPDNGGPAFPANTYNYTDKAAKDHFGNPIDAQSVNAYGGMTLRDYFAAKAMQGLLKVNRPSDIGVMRQEWADEAYLLADAMMEARQS